MMIYYLKYIFIINNPRIYALKKISKQPIAENPEIQKNSKKALFCLKMLKCEIEKKVIVDKNDMFYQKT